MKSKVYFVPVSDKDNSDAVIKKIKALLGASAILNIVQKNYKTAVKIHFGEEGNTGFVRPEYARVICDAIADRKASGFLTDTNTLYRGQRMNSRDHVNTAHKHGFTKKITGVDVVIPDESVDSDKIDVKVDAKFIKTARLASIFIKADAIVAISHFKGHMMTGFGGALKNIGMGCATREGKLAQHCDVSPFIYEDRCKACGACVKICPVNAIRIENKRARIDKSKCIGCANCIAVCPAGAMFIDFGVGAAVQDKMVEYAAAVIRKKPGRMAYLNFALRINKECDCWGMENPRIAPDVGIFASLDPVAIDKASLDMVKRSCGKDIFKEHHPLQDANIQLNYAADLGLGSLNYELVEMK